VTVGSWVTYSKELFDLAEPINFSLGHKYVDNRSTHSTSFGIPDGYVPSYSVFDAGVSYSNDNWKVQANIYNLFDKVYYNKAMFLGGMPGDERNVKLKVTYAF
jgi:outer membrane receptor protein involved in Fe transport